MALKNTGVRVAFSTGRRRNAQDGFKQVEGNFIKLVNGINDVSEEVLTEILQAILDRAMELVPVNTGVLRDSNYIEVRPFKNGVAGEIGFAKGGIPHYGIIVHERLDLAHKPPTQAKFLQRAVQEHQDRVKSKVEELVRERAGI